VHGPGWEERYAYGPDGTCGYGQWPTAPTAPAAAAPVGAAPAAGAPAAAAEPDDDLSAAAGPREYAGSQVRRAGRTYYQHDAAGRLVLRTRRTLSGRTRAWRYAWDSEDRLTAVSTPDGEFWQYGYDPLGRRISKRRLAGGVVLEQVDFCWDGTVLAEQTRTVYAANGPQAATTTWEYAPGGRTPLTQLDRYWPAAGAAPAQRLHLVVSDPVGSPTELIGAGGTLTWYRAGNLWGGPRRAVRQAGADCPLRFPGQYEDAETGLHYNLMRYYDPATARYCSPDPLGCPGGPDPHAYVPNPTVWCDPLGLSCEDALNALGVDDAGKQAFHNGDVVQFGFPTEHGSVDGFLQHSDGKLTAQIFSIHDTEGGGAAGFMKFMRESLNLGRSLGLSEVELQGGALINKELEAGLLKRGFLPKQIPIPEALGGGGMLDVLYKVFPVLPVR
jgi:RHS repeat-associated protein